MATPIYLRITQTHPGARSVTPDYNDALRATSNASHGLTAEVVDEANGERPFKYFTGVVNRYVFFSERVSTGFDLSGNITVTLRTSVPAGGIGFFKITARIYKITAGGSDIESLIGEGTTSAAVGSIATQTITITPPATVAIARNERFIFRFVAVPADGSQTFGSSEVPTISFNNVTPIDSNVSFTETFTLRDNGTKLWFRRTTAAAIGDFFDMLETRGAATIINVVETTAGGTQIQLTRQRQVSVAEVAAATINDTGNLSAYTSASFTPAPNKLYLLAVVHSDAATEATVPTITTTTGLAFVQVGASMPFNTIAANANRITLFRAMKPSGLSAGTYTVNLADAGTGVIAQLVECDAVQTTGSDGADAVRNIVTGSANAGANPSITLAALQEPYHGTIGFFGSDIATAPTAGTGLTLLGTPKNQATPTSGHFTVYDTFAAGTVVNATLVASDWAGIALEIVALPEPTALEWISPRLAEGFVATAAANFLGQFYVFESVATVNASIRTEVLRRDPLGTETLLYYKHDTVELGTSTAQRVFSITGTFAGETACQEDDRLVVRVYAVNVGTMGVGYAGVTFDGPTPNISGDSFLTLLDGPDLKDEADPARSLIVPSGGSLMGLSNGQ